MRQLAALVAACLLLPAIAGAVATPAAKGGSVRALPDMPTPRAAHSASLLRDGTVLLAGGCHAQGCEEGISDDAVLFDPARGTFIAAGKLAQPRVGHRAIALRDGSVLLLGGWTPDGATALVERYDPATRRFSPHGRLLQARDHLRAAATTLHPARWRAVYAPQLRILEEDILSRFAARELAAAEPLLTQLPPLPELR